MARILIAKSTISKKEVVVCSDVDTCEDRQAYGDTYVSDDDVEYITEELGAEYTLEIVEEY